MRKLPFLLITSKPVACEVTGCGSPASHRIVCPDGTLDLCDYCTALAILVDRVDPIVASTPLPPRPSDPSLN